MNTASVCWDVSTLVLLCSGGIFQRAVAQNSQNAAQGNSQWSLDPYLGTYDMDMTKQINFVNFSNGLLGIPVNVVLSGERQAFSKSADGSKYVLTVSRPGANTTIYDSSQQFVLGIRAFVSNSTTPQIPSIDILYTMTNATTLQGQYNYKVGGVSSVFTVFLYFKSDASGYFDVANVTSPSPFVATAPFNRNSAISPVAANGYHKSSRMQ